MSPPSLDDLAGMTLDELRKHVTGHGALPDPTQKDLDYVARLAVSPRPHSCNGEAARVRSWLRWYFNLSERQVNDMMLGYFVALNMGDLGKDGAE